jgi:hypothetical protein
MKFFKKENIKIFQIMLNIYFYSKFVVKIFFNKNNIQKNFNFSLKFLFYSLYFFEIFFTFL